jgi:hypothetical protein
MLVMKFGYHAPNVFFLDDETLITYIWTLY